MHEGEAGGEVVLEGTELVLELEQARSTAQETVQPRVVFFSLGE